MVVRVHTAQTSIVLFLFQKLANFKDMSALQKMFYSMATPLCRKYFSSFSTYVLSLNFFFKELGFATFTNLPAFTVCLSELCFCLWFAYFHCLPLWICLLSPCACLNSLWSTCFHCLPVLLLSDVSGFTAVSQLCYCLLFTFSLWLYDNVHWAGLGGF